MLSLQKSTIVSLMTF